MTNFLPSHRLEKGIVSTKATLTKGSSAPLTTAIGGVSPIGHMSAVTTYAENGLLSHDTLWAAAGAHDAVFRTEPGKLLAAAAATVADIAE